MRVNKAQQVSDWQCRPLSEPQLRYAALDGLVLLRLHSHLVATSDPEVTAEWPLTTVIIPADVSTTGGVDTAGGAHYRANSGPMVPVGPPSTHGPAPTPDELALHLGTAAVVAHLTPFALADRVVFVEPSPTAAIAAAHLNVSPKHIINSLAFIANGNLHVKLIIVPNSRVSMPPLLSAGDPVIVLVSGVTRVCFTKLSGAVGVPKKRLKMASRPQCLEVFGYLPGSFPPCAYRDGRVRVILDS